MFNNLDSRKICCFSEFGKYNLWFQYSAQRPSAVSTDTETNCKILHQIRFCSDFDKMKPGDFVTRQSRCHHAYFRLKLNFDQILSYCALLGQYLCLCMCSHTCYAWLSCMIQIFFSLSRFVTLFLLEGKSSLFLLPSSSECVCTWICILLRNNSRWLWKLLSEVDSLCGLSWSDGFVTVSECWPAVDWGGEAGESISIPVDQNTFSH